MRQTAVTTEFIDALLYPSTVHSRGRKHQLDYSCYRVTDWLRWRAPEIRQSWTAFYLAIGVSARDHASNQCSARAGQCRSVCGCVGHIRFRPDLARLSVARTSLDESVCVDVSGVSLRSVLAVNSATEVCRSFSAVNLLTSRHVRWSEPSLLTVLRCNGSHLRNGL